MIGMKALVYKGPEMVELEDIPQPTPVDDESLLKIQAVGVCGSDFEGFLGKTGRRTPPMVMGHELAGTVETPAGNSKFRQGDKVVVQPKLYCGECTFCQQGLTNLCSGAEFFGVLSKNGGMAEYLAVPERCLFRIKDEIDFPEACMVEPLAVAYRSVHQLHEDILRQAEYTLLVGAGTIGLLILQMLKLRGARNLIVSDLSDHRLEIARKLGANLTLNPQKEDVLSRIKEITAGAMADVAMEAVGFEASVSHALSSLKNRGTMVWVGLAQRMIEVNMHQIVTAELNIRGSFLYSENDFIDSLKLIESRRIQLNPIITLSERLEKGVDVFDRLKDNKDGRIVKVILQND
jgi:2-desacetyl-2-hydroxyethyl bacteriochlorophyllide A dehydrogenase